MSDEQAEDTTESSVDAIEPVSPEALTKLARWTQDARAAYPVARMLSRTPFVPKEMENRADVVLAVILTGQEVGLEPMAALRSIDIIQGVPAMRANTMRGLVQGAGHEIWVDDDSNETRAIVHGRRRDSDRLQSSTWTIDRARSLGIANRDNYRKQPGAMLVARGTSEICRLIGADVLLGMPYSIEELDDGGEQTEKSKSTKATKSNSRKRTAQRKPIDGPPLDEPQPSGETADVSGESSSEPSAPTLGEPDSSSDAESAGADTG